eukprot:jgi/Mesen1/2956/ME000176S01996
MDPVLVTVKAKLKPGGKGPGIDGVLMMTEKRFTWTPNDPRAAVKLEVDLNNIKSHRWSKQTPNSANALLKFGTSPDPAAEGGYVFMFHTFPDRDKCRDVYSSFQAKYQQASQKPTVPPGVPTAAATPGLPPGSDKLDSKEALRRQQILQADPKLRKLFQDLVMGGAITEAEFWAARKHLLEGKGSDKKRKQQQRTGIASAMLADVRGVADGRSNKVTFNLTPAIIHQIFAEKPAVQKAFLDCVPAKMSEKEFWTKYCRAEYLMHTKSEREAREEAEVDEDLALFMAHDAGLEENTRRRIQRVDPTLDVATDDYDDLTSTLGGHGVWRDGTDEGPLAGEGSKRKRSVVAELNRHAAVVLEGRFLDDDEGDTKAVAEFMAARSLQAAQDDTGGDDAEASKARAERARQMTEIDDLEKRKAPAHIPLRIQDPRKYFDAQAAAASTAASADGQQSDQGEAAPAASSIPAARLTAQEAAAAFARQVASLKDRQAVDCVLLPSIAKKVLEDFAQHMRASKQMEGPAAEKNFLDLLPPALQGSLFSHAEAVKELLKHFWATYPVTNPVLLQKAERHKDGVVKLYDRLEKLKGSAAGEHRHVVSQLLQPMFQPRSGLAGGKPFEFLLQLQFSRPGPPCSSPTAQEEPGRALWIKKLERSHLLMPVAVLGVVLFTAYALSVQHHGASTRRWLTTRLRRRSVRTEWRGGSSSPRQLALPTPSVAPGTTQLPVRLQLDRSPSLPPCWGWSAPAGSSTALAQRFASEVA